MSQEIRKQNALPKWKRRRQMARRCSYVVMIVWAFLGMVGLITIAQWIVGVCTGREERVFGRGLVWERQADDTVNAGKWNADAVSLGEVADGTHGDTDAPRYEFTEEERQMCRTLLEQNPQLLVLVNKEHELDAAFDSQLRGICNGRLQASAWMYEDLAAMLRAAGDAGFDYWIASAYRSRERQQELIDEDVTAFMQQGMSYDEALARTLAETMPAGHSEHETGLALDILCSGNTQMDDSQADEPGNQWLVAHCAQYGFILRYPADAVSITGIDYEPWHLRYVGRDAAVFLMERGITLEEFVEAATDLR